MGDLGLLLDLTFIFTAILLIGAMSGYLSEKAGIVNIGIDGMMCIGAVFFGIYSATYMHLVEHGFGTIFVLLILTMISTMVVGAMHAFATINLKANHIISGTAINLIGLSLATFLNEPLAKLLYNGQYSKIMCLYTSDLPMGPSLYCSSLILFFVAIILCAIIWVVVTKTRVGLRYQAVGENPFSVDAQGINVTKYQWIAVLLSSALAGLAGGLFLFKTISFGGNVQSMGYLSLTILIAGGWKLQWMSIFAVVFAIFTSCANTTTFTQLGIPQQLVFAIPYIITLFILLFSSKKVLPPAHSGIPFERTRR